MKRCWFAHQLTVVQLATAIIASGKVIHEVAKLGKSRPGDTCPTDRVGRVADHLLELWRRGGPLAPRRVRGESHVHHVITAGADPVVELLQA